MAIDSNSYFSNQANVGLGGATAGTFNKFDLHATPKYALGFKVEQADGSVYRYVHTGAASNRGVLLAGDLSETSQVDLDDSVIAPASAVAVSGEALKPGSIGSRYVEVTIAAITADQFAGAKFVTTDDTGEGYTYDVIGNTATDNPASGNIRLELAQPLQVALDATTDVAITGNRYSDVETSNTADVDLVGVACATTTSALPYCWAQSKGVVGILQDGSISVGNAITPSSAGNVKVVGAVTDYAIGVCVDTGDTTGHGTFKINLE